MKRLLGGVLALMLGCAPAAAEINTRQETISSVGTRVAVTTFTDGDVPDTVREILTQDGEWTQGEIVSGTLREQNESSFALLCVETDGVRRLLCLSKTGSDPWTRQSLGEKLPQEGAMVIDCDVDNGTVMLNCEIDGENCVFTISRVSVSGMLFFRVEECSTQEEDGSSYWVRWTGGGASDKEAEYNKYCATHYASDGAVITRKCLRWLTAAYDSEVELLTFPRTTDDLESAAAEGEAALVDDDLGCCIGCNLRTEATTKSKSLGMYNGNVLVHVTGYAEGKSNPWYQVRVGEVTGWMDSAYVTLKENSLFLFSAVQPVPVGRAMRETKLLDTASGNAVDTVRAGTEFHVMAEYNGYVHVMLPRDEIGDVMDADGQSGYLAAEDVEQAATLALLRGEE